MNIRLATDSDQNKWDTYVLTHPQGLPYHQFAWKAVVEEAYGFKGIYLVAEINDEFAGVLPLIDFEGAFGRRMLISLPYCDAGGGLADNTTIVKALMNKAVILSRLKKTKGLQVRFSYPLDGIAEGHSMNVSKARMVLLLPESAVVLLGSFKAKLRSQIKKPIQDGLKAKMGGVELVDEFYQVFSENMRNLGSPVHSRKWVHAVVSKFDERAKVCVIYTPDGVAAAAGIALFHNETVSIPWASSLGCFKRLNANMLLYWSFLSFAADRKFKYFDFGRSTPGEGTYKFKEQWGAKPQELTWMTIPSEAHQGSYDFPMPITRKQVAEIWKRMPLGVCNFVGPFLRRQISL